MSGTSTPGYYPGSGTSTPRTRLRGKSTSSMSPGPSLRANAAGSDIAIISTTRGATPNRYGATHFWGETETAAYVNYVNTQLHDDPDLAGILPVSSEGTALFEACRNGLLLAKLVSRAVPGSIDENELHLRPRTAIHMHENHSRMLAGCKKAGIRVHSIASGDLVKGVPHLCLSLIWQIIQISVLSKLKADYRTHMGDDDRSTPLRDTNSHEKYLLAWVNVLLSTTSTPRRITNFTTDLTDSECLIHLIQSLTPVQNLTPSHSPTTITTEPDLTRRAELVLEAADRIGCRQFASASDIVSGNRHLNLAFLAVLYNRCAGRSDIPKLEDGWWEVGQKDMRRKRAQSMDELGRSRDDLGGRYTRAKSVEELGMDGGRNDTDEQREEIKTLRKMLEDVEDERRRREGLETGGKDGGDEMERVREEAKRSRMEAAALESEVRRLKEQLDIANEERRRSEEVLKRVRSETNLCITEIPRLRDQLEKVEEEIKRATTQCEELTRENVGLREQVETRADEMQRMETDCAAHLLENSELKERLEAAMAEIERLEAENRRGATVTSSSADVASIRNELDAALDRIKKVEAEREAFLVEREEVREENHDLREKQRELREEYEGLKQENTQLQDEVDGMLEDLNEQERMLKERLSEAAAAIDSTTKEKMRIKEETERQVSEHAAVITLIKAEKQRLVEEIEQREKEHTRAIDRLASEKQLLEDELERGRKDMSWTIERHESEKRHLKEEIERKAKDASWSVDRLTKEKTQIQAELQLKDKELAHTSLMWTESVKEKEGLELTVKTLSEEIAISQEILLTAGITATTTPSPQTGSTASLNLGSHLTSDHHASTGTIFAHTATIDRDENPRPPLTAATILLRRHTSNPRSSTPSLSTSRTPSTTDLSPGDLTHQIKHLLEDRTKLREDLKKSQSKATKLETVLSMMREASANRSRTGSTSELSRLNNAGGGGSCALLDKIGKVNNEMRSLRSKLQSSRGGLAASHDLLRD